MDSPRPASTSRPADAWFRAIVLGFAAVLALGLVRLQLCAPLALPAKPPMPETQALSLSQAARATQANPMVYRGHIDKDAAFYEVTPGPTLEQMSAVLPYRDHTETHVLDPRAAKAAAAADHAVSRRVEALGLSIDVSVRKTKGSRKKYIALTIENHTDSYLAYNVSTRPGRQSRLCDDPPEIRHNAMVLPPRGKVVRGECWYHSTLLLELTRVQVIELPALAYHYVSRVPPEAAGIPNRLGRGHRPPKGATCPIMLSAQLRSDLENNRVAWRDVIDFYARHRCDSYRFPGDYRAFDRHGERALPAVTE